MGNLLIQYPEMANVNAEFSGAGSLTAKIGQPLTSLKVIDVSRAEAVYLCTLSTGTLQFTQGDDT